MTEEEAHLVMEALGGKAWQSGGNIWLVLIERGDGRLVVISDDVVCEYPDQEAFDASQASASITLV